MDGHTLPPPCTRPRRSLEFGYAQSKAPNGHTSMYPFFVACGIFRFCIFYFDNKESTTRAHSCVNSADNIFHVFKCSKLNVDIIPAWGGDSSINSASGLILLLYIVHSITFGQFPWPAVQHGERPSVVTISPSCELFTRPAR